MLSHSAVSSPVDRSNLLYTEATQDKLSIDNETLANVLCLEYLGTRL